MLIRANKRFRRHPILAEINITPFTDVILVLLVIFMVTTPLMSQSTIKVKLPESKSAQPLEVGKKERSFVSITSEGVLYLDSKVVTRKELKEKLAAIREKTPDLGIVFRIDKSVRFKDVVEILDTFNELTITKLDIETLNRNLQ